MARGGKISGRAGFELKFDKQLGKKLERTMKLLEKVPQTAVTQAAKAGATVAFKSAKAKAPVDSGELRRGIVLKGEKGRIKGKKVYDVKISEFLNDVFVKISAEGKRSYYPASQEYGFFAANGRYIPGTRYMRKSLDENPTAIKNATLEKLGKALDKALKG